MGVLDMPKAMYKAQQAKKKMQKIQVVGQHGSVSVLMNGLNDIVEIEINEDAFGDNEDMTTMLKRIAEDTKKAIADAKKALEKEMMNSANLDDIKEMLGM